MSRIGLYGALAAMAGAMMAASMAGPPIMEMPTPPRRGGVSSKRSMRGGWQGNPKRWPFAPGETAVLVSPERRLLYMHSAARRRALAEEAR